MIISPSSRLKNDDSRSWRWNTSLIWNSKSDIEVILLSYVSEDKQTSFKTKSSVLWRHWNWNWNAMYWFDSSEKWVKFCKFWFVWFSRLWRWSLFLLVTCSCVLYNDLYRTYMHSFKLFACLYSKIVLYLWMNFNSPLSCCWCFESIQYFVGM